MNYNNFLIKLNETLFKKLSPYKLHNIDFLWRLPSYKSVDISSNKDEYREIGLYEIIKKYNLLERLKDKGVINNSNLKRIGSGIFSEVYEIDNNRVLKITFDIKTAEMHKWIYDNSNNQIIKDSVANVYNVGKYYFSKKLKLSAPFHNLKYIDRFYFIICEKLNPYPFTKQYINSFKSFINHNDILVGGNINKKYIKELVDEIDYKNDEEYKFYYNTFKLILNKIIKTPNNKDIFEITKLIALSNLNIIELNEYEKNIIEVIYRYILEQLDDTIIQIYDLIYNLAKIGFIHKDVHLQQFGVDSNYYIKFYEFDGKIINQNKKSEIKTIIRENKKSV